jgi:hypothetical protein
MPAFGTGVDASLGRIDYTPYLQGSMQGSSALGHGIASLGQEAAVAVKQYYDKKETNNLLDATTKSVQEALKTDPYLAQSVGIKDPTDTKAIGVAIQAFGGGDKKAGVAAVTKMLAQHGEQKVEDNAVKAATQTFIAPGQQVQAYLSAGGKDALGFQTKMAQLESAQASSAANRAQVGLYGAQAAAAGVPKRDNPSAFDIQYNNAVAAYKEKNPDVEISAETLDQISTAVANRMSPNNPANIDVAAISGLNSDYAKGLVVNAESARGSMQKIASIKNAFSKGTLTGFNEGLKSSVRSFAQGLGFKINEEALANSQALEANFGSFMLDVISKTKGSSSNRETGIFQGMSPSMAKSIGANEILIGLAQDVAQMNIDAEDAYNESLNDGGSLADATNAARKVKQAFNKKTQKTLDDVEEKIRGVNKTPAALRLNGQAGTGPSSFFGGAARQNNPVSQISAGLDNLQANLDAFKAKNQQGTTP